MSLDKVESSNPNLTAVHAGASTGKLGTSNQMLIRLFCLFQTRVPHSSTGTLQVGEKPALLSKTSEQNRDISQDLPYSSYMVRAEWNLAA